MLIAKLKDGYKVEITEEARDNMELVDALVEMETNPLAVSKVVKLLMSDDERKRLYDHLRTEKGNVPVAAVAEAITDIFLSAEQPVKN